MLVIKRNNDKQDFDAAKIVNAILKASTPKDMISRSEAMAIAKTIARSLNRPEIDVESIQDTKLWLRTIFVIVTSVVLCVSLTQPTVRYSIL